MHSIPRYPAAHTTFSGETIPTPQLCAIRNEPWLPPELAEATDPGHYSLYTIGHPDIDASGERVYTKLLNWDSSAKIGGKVFFGIPTLMNYYQDPEGQICRTHTPLPPDPEIGSTTNDFLSLIAFNNAMTYIRPEDTDEFLGKNTRVDPTFPMHGYYSKAVPLDPGYNAKRQPPLTLKRVYDFIHTQDVDTSPELLAERFDHMTHLVNYARGISIACSMAYWLIARHEDSGEYIKPLHELALSSAAEFHDQIFTADFLVGHALHRFLNDRFKETVVRRLNNNPRAYQELTKTGRAMEGHGKLFWSYLADFRKVFDTFADGEYPPVLQEMLYVEKESKARRLEKARGPQRTTKKVAEVQPAELAAAPPDTPITTVAEELMTADKLLSERISRFTNTWSLTKKGREAARLGPLAAQFCNGLMRGNQVLLAPMAPNRAEQLADFICLLSQQIDSLGAKKAARLVVNAMTEQYAIQAARTRQRTQAEAHGMPAPRYEPTPNIRILASHLADPEQWAQIEAIIRRHESSNQTVDAVKEFLPYLARLARL